MEQGPTHLPKSASSDPTVLLLEVGVMFPAPGPPPSLACCSFHPSPTEKGHRDTPVVGALSPASGSYPVCSPDPFPGYASQPGLVQPFQAPGQGKVSQTPPVSSLAGQKPLDWTEAGRQVGSSDAFLLPQGSRAWVSQLLPPLRLLRQES